jgi:ElaB/YqjD/DUF883 family membrane-anchored ribosome-binding protein
MENEKDDDTDIIREQMEEKRSAIAQKFGALEDKLTGTVQGAAETVSETVESVKDSVQEISSTVSETVSDAVETVKDTFNVRRHVENNPWAAFGSAVALGCLGGYLLGGRRREYDVLASREEFIASGREREAHPAGGNGLHASRQADKARAEEKDEGPGWFSGWAGDAMKTLAGLGVSAVLGVVRDMTKQSLPDELASRFGSEIDNLTSKLGVSPIRGPVLPEKEDAEQSRAGGPSASSPRGQSKGRRTTDGTGRR